MRDVQAVGDLGAVIAGVAVLLNHDKGTEGMTKIDAMAHLDKHVLGPAAERTQANVDRVIELLNTYWLDSRPGAPASEVSLSQSDFGDVLNKIPQLTSLLELALPQMAGQQSPTQIHITIDSNGDGALSLKEIRAVLRDFLEERATTEVPAGKAPEKKTAAATRGRTRGEEVRLETAEDAELVAKAAKTFLDKQDRNSTLYKAAEWEYNDEMPMNAAPFLTTDEKIEYANAKANNPEIYGAIKRALWDRQNAWPSNKPEPSTRPVLPSGTGDGGYALRPPSVLKF